MSMYMRRMSVETIFYASCCSIYIILSSRNLSTNERNSLLYKRIFSYNQWPNLSADYFPSPGACRDVLALDVAVCVFVDLEDRVLDKSVVEDNAVALRCLLYRLGLVGSS